MNYKVPVIPGDGIGPEIIAEGRKVLEAAGESTVSPSIGSSSPWELRTISRKGS